MAMAHEFEYEKPGTIGEAVEILASGGPNASVLAGGTDLVPWMREDLVDPEVVVDIKGIDGLGEITQTDDRLVVGGLATFSDLIDSALVAERIPLLVEMAKTVASPGVRNRATLVGNICSAVPSCDSGPALMAYQANVLVAGSSGAREIAIADWFIGPKRTALKDGELVTGVSVPVPEDKHGGCYVKLGRYKGEDLAQASVTALALAGNRYRVAFGAVAATPVRGGRIEALLDGKELDDSLIEACVRLVPEEIAPIDDVRASREYRMRMVEVMLKRALRAAVARRAGEGPDYGTSLV